MPSLSGPGPELGGLALLNTSLMLCCNTLKAMLQVTLTFAIMG